MPCYGGLTPAPRRMGGGKPRLAHIVESLNRARGTAYDTSHSSTVYADNLAQARCLSGAWGTNQRLAHVRVPKKLTGTTLSRWEKILGYVPDPSSTDVERRDTVAEKFEAFGVAPTRQAVVDLLTDKLGDVFVDLEYLSIANAIIIVPDGTYPFGSTNAAVAWSSSVARVLVRTQQPSNVSLGEFLTIVQRVFDVLEPLVPAWVTYDWYLPGPVSVAVSGGPSAGGFYLDDEHNLDFEVFDV